MNVLLQDCIIRICIKYKNGILYVKRSSKEINSKYI